MFHFVTRLNFLKKNILNTQYFRRYSRDVVIQLKIICCLNNVWFCLKLHNLSMTKPIIVFWIPFVNLSKISVKAVNTFTVFILSSKQNCFCHFLNCKNCKKEHSRCKGSEVYTVLTDCERFNLLDKHDGVIRDVETMNSKLDDCKRALRGFPQEADEGLAQLMCGV